MINRKQKSVNPDQQEGQSLVELALFIPIFVILLAGMVEVSQFVVTQNRISNATRSTTRFASNGGEDAGMKNVLINSITQTLQVDEDVWDVFSVRATLNAAGTGFDDWEFNHIYGISNTQDISTANEIALQDRILEDLQFDEDGTRITNIEEELGGLRIVGTYAIHDIESILNLDATPALSSIYSVSQLNVMRISGLNVEQSNGCAAFPIALHQSIRSISGPTGSSPYPTNFEFPTDPPTYDEFVNHTPAMPLETASEGTIFLVTRGFNQSNFGWLVWNQGITPDANTLSNSLTWPGNSVDYNNYGDAGVPAAADYPYVVRGYAEPGDNTDTELQIDDWVAASGAQLPEIAAAVQDNIRKERDLRLITWTQNNPTLGTNGHYKIDRFAVFKIRGYGNSAGDEWLLLEFVRWDDSCGQVLGGT